MNVKDLRFLYKNVACVNALLFILFLFSNQVSAQSTVYIDPTYTGSTQNGSIQYPYNSWASISWTNGTTYLQKAGTTYNTTSTLIITSKNNITLGSYGTGIKPKIISSAASTSKVIDITSCYNMTVTNLEVASTTGQITAAVIIDGTGSSNNLIDNCILRDTQWGIRILTTSPGNKILNCEVYNTQDDGIYIKDTPDIEIAYCNVHDVNLKYFINPDQSYSAGDNIQIASTYNHNFNIHHNILDHSSTGNKFCFIAWGNNYTGTLEHNTMIGNSSQVTSCIYLSPTTGSVTVRYNTIKNGNYGIYAYVSNFNVYYNTFIQNKNAICVLNNYHMLAENNVFYNNMISSITAYSGSQVISKNNIFNITGSGKAYSTSGSLVSNYNNFNTQASGFINGHSTLSSWQSASGQDLNSMVANPQFVNPSAQDFKLQSNSPCINSGVNCGYNQDFFGNQVPVANFSDIGYFEYSSTSGNQPPVISNQTLSVPENSANSTVVGQVTASDPDPNQTITYSISGGNTGSTFAINATNGLITVANGQNLNFESTPQYLLQVAVQDNLGLSSSATVTINVTNVNENPVIEDQGFNVNENSPTGTLIGNIIASDPDQSQQLSYSIISGNTGGTFAINSSSGALTVANNQLLNFEETTQFILNVKVQDNGTGNLYDQANISVSLANVNECPVVADQTFSMNSAVQNGYVVGQINAFDPDQNQALNYLIVNGNTLNIFSLNYTTGLLTVTNASALNNVTNPVILSVKVSDNGSPQLSSNCTVTVNITQNNNPPVINAQNFQINENSPVGAIVGQVLASDPDQGQSLTFSIISGNNSNAFNLSSTGVLTVANPTALNYETGNMFSLVIMVADNGNPVLTAQAQINISVNNVNDAPIVVPGQSFQVLSTSPNGTIVGTVQYEDEDSGQTASFTIIGGNLFNAFAINSTTGEITVINSSSLRKLANKTVQLNIQVTDNGSPALSSSGIVEIKVIRKKTVGAEITNNTLNGSNLIYPNPSPDGNFNLRTDLEDTNDETTLIITDLNGKLINQSVVKLNGEHHIDLTNMPKGIYLLHIIQGENKELKKLVIQ
ncbi:MAG TPA: cadherin domain-containing protein [Lentimicrobium sp.]|nr:cadherin domain-containing protein [Lentimicrobium sp.]